MISIHIWGYTIKMSTIINIYYECSQHIYKVQCKFFVKSTSKVY